MKEKRILWLPVFLLGSVLIFVLLVWFLAPYLPQPQDEPEVVKLQVSTPINVQLVVPENDSQKEEGPPRFTGGSR